MLTRHFGFHPYRPSFIRSFCKHLQDMPVKVADRCGTGCADANLTGSLDIHIYYTDFMTIKSIFIVAKTFNWCYSMLS